MIYYCDDLPHPTKEHEAFIEKGVERLLEILNISNGKALVLFTAKTDMEEVYSILSEKNLPYKILMQQPGSSQDKVLNEFKEDTNSVLLGTGAYWEGISIEGKSLSNVIIFRLPFPVPDPIIEYKCSGGSSRSLRSIMQTMPVSVKLRINRPIPCLSLIIISGTRTSIRASFATISRTRPKNMKPSLKRAWSDCLRS